MVHCQSREDDLGVHVLNFSNLEYGWKFCENAIESTLFNCRFWRSNSIDHQTFPVFNRTLFRFCDQRFTDSNTCHWGIKSDGFYLFDNHGQVWLKQYDWEHTQQESGKLVNESAVGYVVHLKSDIINDSVSFRCQSKDDDLGYRVFRSPDLEYEWSFCKNFSGSTLFFCHFWWQKVEQRFDVFNGSMAQWCNEDKWEGNTWLNVVNGCSPFVIGYVVHIKSDINNDDVTVHCQSKDDDLGNHVLHAPNLEYQWSFCQNILFTALYYCHFGWKNVEQTFDVFNRDLALWCNEGRSEGNTCNWEVKEDGFYFNVNHTTWRKYYSWNPKTFSFQK
ncbi:hypothetical protein QVD17_01144 [Tagetes erecta]|uniref:S-protein homolog n=1 Tax=Tagetes erecta TaxID=13708 RepID=A0AAD8L977_TARER|nr:hypothetical protein QVD17_01144 [Tagetes erecta]